MDAIQTSICNVRNVISQFLSDRNKLRAALADCLPTNKLQQNLLMNAYDCGITQSLQKGTDIVMLSLNYIAQLESDYGITKDRAFWAVQTWCYILKFTTEAEALDVLQPSENSKALMTPTNSNSSTEYNIGLGVYRAGTDFPAGQLSIRALVFTPYGFYYGVGKNPSRINDDEIFTDKTYVEIKEGQFLKLSTDDNDAEYRFVVKVIST